MIGHVHQVRERWVKKSSAVWKPMRMHANAYVKTMGDALELTTHPHLFPIHAGFTLMWITPEMNLENIIEYSVL